MNINKNEIINIDITGMTTEGSGVGRYNGMAVFVPNTAVGDNVDALIIKTSKNYAIGKISKLVSASSDRIEPDCKCFLQCGGCTYRHISYDAELKIKQQRVEDAITRIGGVQNLAISTIIGGKNVNGYRNKAQLPVGVNKNNDLITGFYAYHSHRIIDSENCLLQPPVFERTIKVFKRWAAQYKPMPYNEKNNKGILRHLYLRYGEKSNQLMVCLVINGNKIDGIENLAVMLKENIPEFKSLVLNINKEKTNVILGKKCKTIYGSGYIKDTLCGLDFNISPLSFYQVNREQAQVLYTIAKEYADLQGTETLLDLYCGTGTIGLSMAKNAKNLIGVEVIPQAVENAIENAKNNNISNARFICGDAKYAAEKLCEEGVKPNVIVLDPPRKGCDTTVIAIVAQMNPEKIVYVSCDPATLARDIKQLAQEGYFPQKLTPVDMFPRTSHVETVVLMSRVDK